MSPTPVHKCKTLAYEKRFPVGWSVFLPTLQYSAQLLSSEAHRRTKDSKFKTLHTSGVLSHQQQFGAVGMSRRC